MFDPSTILGGRALEHWNAVYPLVASRLRVVELPLLAAYCEAFESWEQASQHLRGEDPVETSTTQGGSTTIVSPWVTVREQAANRMASLAKTLGLTPDARLEPEIDLTRYFLHATYIEGDSPDFGPPPDDEAEGDILEGEAVDLAESPAP